MVGTGPLPGRQKFRAGSAGVRPGRPGVQAQGPGLSGLLGASAVLKAKDGSRGV